VFLLLVKDLSKQECFIKHKKLKKKVSELLKVLQRNLYKINHKNININDRFKKRAKIKEAFLESGK